MGDKMILRKSILVLTSAVISLLFTGCNACTEQHDPRADHARFNAERVQANKAPKLLNEDGSYPAPIVKKEGEEKTAGSSNAAMEKYQQFCVACHGADGKANGAAAMAMNPKPRNFTDKSWAAKVDDARIAKVIKDGGASVGLSPSMAPWGALLSDEDIKGIVKVIRDFSK